MERLKNLADCLDIEIHDEQIKQFQTYYEMLIETNKVMNLTAITDLDEVITKHFLDSIALAGIYKDIMHKDFKVIDLGTGAGFPGIHLKIVFPHLQIVLMDSLNKRINFLKSVIDALELSGIEAIHGRAEEMARKPQYRQQFDLCVSRAVANLCTLNEYCLPFVKTGGRFISYKASNIEEEVNESKNAIKILGGKLWDVKELELPFSDIKRTFVFIDKIKDTPKGYPRKAGTASKEPIK